MLRTGSNAHFSSLKNQKNTIVPAVININDIQVSFSLNDKIFQMIGPVSRIVDNHKSKFCVVCGLKLSRQDKKYCHYCGRGVHDKCSR